jgi:signal transduction histidine kinase
MTTPIDKASNELIHQSLIQFSSSILTMQGGDDLERLVVTLWVELTTLGLDVRYCGISIQDEKNNRFSFYGVHEKGLLVAERIPFDAGLWTELYSTPEPFLKRLRQGETWRYSLKVSVLRDWLRRIRDRGLPIKGPDPEVPVDMVEVVEIPFTYGTIQLGRELDTPFDQQTIEIVERFAQLLAFGYARYEDLKKLEAQNRDLRIGLAADRLHGEVVAMKRSSDWGKVVSLMRKELLELGIKFSSVSINIIDELDQMFRQNLILPSFVRKKYKPARSFISVDEETDLFVWERPMVPGKVPSPPVLEAWRNKEILRRVIDDQERLAMVQRSQESMGFESSIVHEEAYPRYLLDVPFSAGLISLAAREPQDLTGADEAVLVQMAQNISVAYTRFHDMQQLEKKNRELQDAQTQLVQAAKLAAMGQLVAGVAHEINSPLGTINSNLDVIRRLLGRVQTESLSLPDGVRQRIEESLNAMDPLMGLNRIACERIIRIVRDLRNFARLDEAEFKMANLNEDIETTLNLVRHELKDRIQVIKQFSELPLVPCYPNRLNQVFMNLLINAYQSISGKGEIRISTALIDHEVKIVISDTGTGIKKENLDKIFDPGFTTKGVGVGTGLGLSISAQIVQDHKGRISVESEVGKGSTFTISLPVRRAADPIELSTSL